MSPEFRNKIIRIYPTIQNYAWGGTAFIPELINQESFEDIPVAELWMGDHPKSPAKLGEQFSVKDLRSLIHSDPEHFLGRGHQRFGSRLPFLFKVLDVRDMLSIQAHPNKEEAEIGFAREEAAGLDLHAFNRVFKDDNHKPELMVALSDFWLLHGFQKREMISYWLDTIQAFEPLAQSYNGDIQALYQYVMTLEDSAILQILESLQEELQNFDTSNKDLPHFWAQRAFETFGMDKGIISIYLLNVVHLKKGEAIFQGAGIPHAYLEGQNIEIMANSDNVFRGGLTQKHIDVKLLIDHIRFEEVNPKIMKGYVSPLGKHYPAPVKDFDLHYIQNGMVDFQFAQATIILIFSGSGRLINKQTIDVKKGEVFYILPNTSVQLEGDLTAFLATSVGTPV